MYRAPTTARMYLNGLPGFRWAGILLTLALLAVAFRMPAQVFADDPPVAIEARIDKDVITVGDRIRLTVVVRAAPDVDLQAPQGQEELGSFEVLERRGGTVQRAPDGSQLLRVEYIVTAFTIGSLVLPGVDISFTDGSGAQQQAQGPDLMVFVRSVLDNDPNPQLLDIKPPVSIPGAPYNYTRALATGLLAATTLVLMILIVRRLPRRSRRAVAVAPSASPEETARRALDDIVAAGLVERGQYEELYRRLSLCIRRYVEERYDLPALSSTTSELVREMQRRGTERWVARVVTGVLEECDTVRWAGYNPAENRAQRSLDMAFEIVELGVASPVGAP